MCASKIISGGGKRLRSTEVTTLVQSIAETEAIGPFGDLTIFRGQAFRRCLLPGIARKDPKVDTNDLERTVLKQLTLQGAALLGQAAPTDLDLMVVAQHFGLKTRLLDWSSNPLAALWFACSNRADGDVYVYALEADDLLAEDIYSKDPFAAAKTRVIQPRLNNSRIVAQSGWFTLHRYSKKARRFVPLESNADASPFLHEICIPARSRKAILWSLDRHGVTSSTLFPDLEGLCSQLNRKYRLI